MTEEELEALRQKMQVLARDALMDWLAGQLAALAHMLVTDPQLRLELAARWSRKLQEKRAEYDQIAIRGVAPEWSDLYSAEFQEGFDAAAKRVEAILLTLRPQELPEG